MAQQHRVFGRTMAERLSEEEIRHVSGGDECDPTLTMNADDCEMSTSTWVGDALWFSD
ncbi:MAG: hypothetical protein GYB68_07045 [Chloroflexi bacterium]|nr:hypothetical protein [Chloroflexota bacterium]